VRHSKTSVYSGVELVISYSSSSSHFYSIRPTRFSRMEFSCSSVRFAIWLSPISIGIGSAMKPHRQLPHWISLAMEVPNIWSSLFSSSVCSSLSQLEYFFSLLARARVVLWWFRRCLLLCSQGMG
jgi:hypothetical protein